MEFSIEAMKSAFQWVGEGNYEYSEVESLDLYQATNKLANMIKDWMFEEHHELKGNALINAKRTNFFPTVKRMISMLSRVLGKEDNSKFNKEIFGFIVMISKGKRIKWSNIISDTLADHLLSIRTTKKFCMNSYLVYLLLHGKYRPTSLGEEALIMEGSHAVWKCYPKWRFERRWNSYFMRNDGWQYEIYKELKREVSISRISNSTKYALKRYGDFFLQTSISSISKFMGLSWSLTSCLGMSIIG